MDQIVIKRDLTLSSCSYVWPDRVPGDVFAGPELISLCRPLHMSSASHSLQAMFYWRSVAPERLTRTIAAGTAVIELQRFHLADVTRLFPDVAAVP